MPTDVDGDPPTRARVPAHRPGVERGALGLLVLGVVLPYSRVLPWVGEHGLDLRRFSRELFGSRVGSFFGWDVIVSSATLIVAAAADDQLRPAQRAMVAVGALGGSSVGLPLHLWLRVRNRRAGGT